MRLALANRLATVGYECPLHRHALYRNLQPKHVSLRERIGLSLVPDA
jgi:hypothetical protein